MSPEATEKERLRKAVQRRKKKKTYVKNTDAMSGNIDSLIRREASPRWIAEQATARNARAVKAGRLAQNSAEQEARKRAKNEARATKQRIRRAEVSSKATAIEATEQQRRLFYDHPGRKSLEIAWESAERGSWFAKLGRTGSQILGGTPATCVGDKKTYTLGDSKSINDLLSIATIPEIYVIRDTAWLLAREQQTMEEYLQGLSDEAQPGQQLEVQDLSLADSQPAACAMEVTTCLARLRESGGQVSTRPVNLLNLSNEDMELTPLPLARHCVLLRDACNALFSKHKASFKSKRKVHSPADIQSCQRFRICAQAGAVSSWHMDNLAPYTWITLEGNSESGNDESVLKYWAVIDFQSVSAEDEAAAREAFARAGTDWVPEASWIRVISLVRGDTLIMPPGTIHAPITVTDCLFRGGMCWRKEIFVRCTLPFWRFISRNRDKVTNEDPPLQSKGVIDWITSNIQKNPEKYGITHVEVATACTQLQHILKDSKSCRCDDCQSNPKCACHSRNHLCMDACVCSCRG